MEKRANLHPCYKTVIGLLQSRITLNQGMAMKLFFTLALGLLTRSFR